MTARMMLLCIDYQYRVLPSIATLHCTVYQESYQPPLQMHVCTLYAVSMRRSLLRDFRLRSRQSCLRETIMCCQSLNQYSVVYAIWPQKNVS